jgi:hypothetical protein
MDKVSTNISLDRPFWVKCKKAAIDRGISLNQLVKNGLKLALNEDDTIKVDSRGKVSNDLRGELSSRK